jgi:hypothetical protein
VNFVVFVTTHSVNSGDSAEARPSSCFRFTPRSNLYLHSRYSGNHSDTIGYHGFMLAKHRNSVGYRRGSVGYHGNSIGYHGNSVGYRSDFVGYRRSSVGYRRNSIGCHSNSIGCHSNLIGCHSNSIGYHTWSLSSDRFLLTCYQRSLQPFSVGWALPTNPQLSDRQALWALPTLQFVAYSVTDAA